MKLKVFSLFTALLLGLAALAPAQQVIVKVNKYPMAGVAVIADGNLWTAAQPTLNYSSALISVRKSGTVSGCTLTFYTGPTAATATSALNDANTTFSCATAVNKILTNVDRYLQGTVSSWTGTGTITIYVTLTNGTGWNLNATLSAVTQGAGSGNNAVRWFTSPTNGTQDQPMGDVQARAINVTPGNGTTAFLDVKGGVGVNGAGVQQTATLGTLSASVAAASLTEVVAAPAGGIKTVLLGVWLEKATATTGTVTVRYGTGTNCASGTTTLLTLGPQTASSLLPIGFYPVNALITAANALCLITDASSTSAKVLTQ